MSKIIPDISENNHQQQWRLTEHFAYLPSNVLYPHLVEQQTKTETRQLMYVCVCVSLNCDGIRSLRDLFRWEPNAPTIRALRAAREKDVSWHYLCLVSEYPEEVRVHLPVFIKKESNTPDCSIMQGTVGSDD